MAFWNSSYEYWKKKPQLSKKSGNKLNSFNKKLRVVQEWGKACSDTEISKMSLVTLASQNGTLQFWELEFWILITIFL